MIDADRLVQVRYFEASDGENAVKTVSFTYDSQGNLLTYDDGVTTGTYAYDDLYRKTGATVDYGLFAKDFSYTYYKNGLKETYTGPDEAAYTYTYDDANQWVSVDIPGQGSITNNVFNWTRPTSTTYPGGAVRNYSYDALMQMKSIEASDPAQKTIMEYHYGRDLEGNITAKGTEHGAYSYAYDDLYQLTSVDNPAIADEGYTYDDVGNRLTELGGAQDYLINANNELISHGNVTCTYDANGNTTSKTNGTDVVNYFYDVENRLIRVEEGDGTVVAQYYYDPFGRRLWKDVAGTRTCYFYTDEGLAAEFTANGTLIKSYGYRPDSTWTTNPLFMVQDSEYYYYQNDHLGTPQKLISFNGAVVWSAVYHAFGKAEVDASSTVVNNLRFAGQYFDAETGFHYNWNRYYDPQTGRYLKADPAHSLNPEGIGIPFLVPWLLETPQDLHDYIYVGGDPINWFDSTGLEGEHTSNARPSTQQKHEDGQARKKKDKGGEKADKARRPNRKKPKGWKGKWPPAGAGGPAPCMSTSDCYCWQHPEDCCNMFPDKCECGVE
ncbi:MAG: RHS domain-containing protein [Desulfatibacillum sp.]|nr:RHS domain-containing protein [Desulfatibacillum sp.]